MHDKMIFGDKKMNSGDEFKFSGVEIILSGDMEFGRENFF
jgi:hypothetical protein